MWSYLILLMSPKSYPDCHFYRISVPNICYFFLPSSNFTLYLKISWQHSAKRQMKAKAKPLHSTIIFQATISRKERQKTDCAYTTVQNRFLMSNGIIFLFFPPLKLFLSLLLNIFTCIMKRLQRFFLSSYMCCNTARTNSAHIYTNPPINICTHAHKIHARRINGSFWLYATPCKYIRWEWCLWWGSWTKNIAFVCPTCTAHVGRGKLGKKKEKERKENERKSRWKK